MSLTLKAEEAFCFQPIPVGIPGKMATPEETLNLPTIGHTHEPQA